MGTRRRAVRRAARLAGLLLSLAGCGSPASVRPEAAAGPLDVGRNLIGEDCRVSRAATGGKGGDGGAVFEVRCGTWEQPSARIERLTAAEPVETLLVSSRWRQRLDAFAACAAPAGVDVMDDVPALALTCKTLRGGWPYQGLGLRAGDAVYLAETIPAAAPPLERAIALLAGRPLPSRDSPGLSRPLPDKAAGSGRSMYSAGDLDRFRQLLRRAQYFNFRGEHAAAETLYRQALDLQQDRLSSGYAGLAYVLMHLALELSNQERFAEAEALFVQAEQAEQGSFDRSEQARLIGYRAVHMANQRRSQRALELAREASSLRREISAGRMAASGRDFQAFDARGATAGSGNAAPLLDIGGNDATAAGDLVQSLYLEGAMLLRQGDIDEADAVLAEALAVLQRESRVPRHWLLRCRVLQARILASRGRTAAAEALLTDSIAAQRKMAANSRTEAQAWLDLSRLQAAHGGRDQALRSFREAVAILEAGQFSLRLEDAMPFFALSLAEAAANPAGRSTTFAEMFRVGQLVRSPSTAQSIGLASARLAANDQESGRLIRELQDARRRVEALDQTLQQARADPAALALQLDALDQARQQAAADAAGLELSVQAAAPNYQYVIDAPVGSDEVRAALRPGETLLQVILGDKRSVGFIVTSDGVEAFPIDLSETEARQYVTQLRAPFDVIVGAPYNVAKAHELYKRLFGRIESRLAGGGALIVVPGGPLLSLPPGVLIASPPAATATGTAHGQYDWLARRHPLTLAPSVQSFVRLRSAARPSQARRSLIGFGDFQPRTDAASLIKARRLPESCKEDAQALIRMPALPETAGELAFAQTLFPSGDSSLLLRGNFTETSVRASPLADYRLVYFATHALLPQDVNCWNEPLLTASAEDGGEGPGHDGLITASEIMDLKLDAELVILSACNTAGPDGQPGGDSLSGLARAFFYAGARALLVTHWRIPDAPTKALMMRFLSALSSGNATAAQALQQAQTALIDDPKLSHPLNWGAFSLVGDGGRRMAGTTAAAGGGGPAS